MFNKCQYIKRSGKACGKIALWYQDHKHLCKKHIKATKEGEE